MSIKPSKLKTISDCSVIVIESSGSVRQMMTDVIKELGFVKITGLSTPKDALRTLEVEPVDWIVTSLVASESINALHLLKIITQQPKLRNTAVTLLWESSNDDSALAHAFELGLLSLHPKVFVRDALLESFKGLFEFFKIYHWDQTLVAAEYVREFLTQKGLHKERLVFEESLLLMYPGSPQVLLSLVEAELALGQLERGAVLLDQLELIDDRMAAHCRRLKQQYQCGTVSPTPDKPKNIMGIRSAVVVDADTDVLFHIEELLAKVGVESIKTFESGIAAVEWLSTSGKEPDLVIMEWKIPGITGAILVQRIRSMGFHLVPIIVLSSLIRNSDTPLLREMGVDECQEKPFDQGTFYKVVIRAIQQNRCPTEEKSLQKKIRQLLHGKKIREAQPLMAQLYNDERVSAAVQKEVEAELYLAKEEFERARDAGIEAVKLGGDSLTMLNLVGKAMLKLREFDGALRCFEKARTLSPNNIERLMNIAEACIEVDKLDEAANVVDKAINLDTDNTTVKELKCKVKIISGKSNAAKDLMGDIESGQSIISYMNNRAVSLARSGRFPEAIEIYKRTCDSVPSTWQEQQASVIYNMGLAYARHGDLDHAASTLDALMSMNLNSDSSVFRRAKSLHGRIKNSIATNAPLVLSVAEDANGDMIVVTYPAENCSSEQKDDLLDKLSNQSELKKGDIGCHLVFKYPEKAPCKLLDNLPSFKMRSTESVKK